LENHTHIVDTFLEFGKEETEQSITDRFEQQARRYSHRLAIKTKSQSLTYQELNAVSNRLAHSILASLGDADGPVALLFNHGASIIIASLGVLKVGKPYAPIDIALPRSKAIQILQDLQASLILTDNAHIQLAHQIAENPTKILNVDDLEATCSNENPGLSISPDQIAYVNYTSGSTGEPKGVVWNHRNELFGIRVKTNQLHISPDDRISLLRFNNVGATRDMFLALLNGAALLVFDLQEEGLTRLGRWLQEEDITVFTCVATIFRHAVRNLDPSEKFLKIRLIHVGGEPLFKTDVELYRNHFSDECILVNRYSISETQAVAYYFVDKRSEIKEDRIPVGYPLDGNEVLLLDDNGNELGANQIGEIAIKSPYLALGYWRRPELTRAKFLPDPNGGKARIYLTGDLGYMLPDGCLVHLGRKDFQRKIRGHRVDLSEIEMALLEVPIIKQVVVVAGDDSRADRRLVAYIVSEPGQVPTSGELRALLKEKLPNYMLPSSFVTMDSLPLTPSGKIDRRALPPPAKSREKAESSDDAMNTPVEKVLVKLWADTMGIEDVGIHDDFSELGGDSLLAAQIVSEVNGIFSLKQPLRTLFQAPTVAKLVEFILANETHPGYSDKIANLLMKIDVMCFEEISKALEKKRGKRSDG
jgi:amino acid adenylation domain-containing protein